jgi:Ca2+-binding EF-hand superfamily protein
MAMTAGAARAEITDLEVVFIKADKNGDFVLSKAEVLQTAIDQFVLSDINGDGQIDKEEAGELASDPEFSDNDTDKSGSLSLDEMIVEKLADFATADKNGDGVLTLDEVTPAAGQN